MQPIDSRTPGVSFAVAVLLILSIVSSVFCFRETSEITSNSIIALRGSADTVWVATDQGFNYSLNGGNDWSGFRESDLGSQLYAMAFGGGFFGAALWSGYIFDYPKIWIFNHGTKKHRQISLNWSD